MLKQMKPNIADIVDMFKRRKDQSDKLGKELKTLGGSIKEYLLDNDLSETESANYIAHISKTPNVSFNEDYAIEIIADKFPDKFSGIVKTKSYIDKDALEAQMYLDADFALALKLAFTEKAPTIRLTVKNKKVGQ